MISSDKDGENKIKSNNNEGNTREDVDYDKLLSAAGEFGLYQIILFCSTFPFYIFGGFSYYSQIFITEVSPNHWCWIPELKNLSSIERRALAIPLDPEARNGYSQCETYNTNWTEVLEAGLRPNLTWSTQSCQNGWEFNKSEIPYPTISSELGWVCEKNNYQATAQSIFFIGSMVGGLFVGWVADKFGRLPAATLSNVLGFVGGISCIFSKNIVQFSLCRFIMGMSYDNCMMMTYLLVLEYVAPKYRSIMSNLPFAIFFTLGIVALPWIALVCGHWKTISIVTSVPMLLSLLAPFVMPESPRWLLSKGRTDVAVSKILTIAKVNKKVIPSKLIEQFQISTLNKTIDDSSILTLFRRPKLRKLLICICLQFMCCITIFDALVRNIGGLEYDFFISFTLLSFTEFPSLILVSFIIDLTGRKGLSVLSFVICLFFIITMVFVSNGLPSVICAIIARFAINICVNTTMQWAAEMLPTAVRGSGSSIVHISSYIGNMLSPYIVYLANFSYCLPLIIMGTISVIGILLTLMLPETAGIEMPQTFDEAEELISNQKLFDIPFLRKKEKLNAGHVNLSFK